MSMGIDLIIGAHDHVELNPPLVVNGTIIAQAGDYGRYLGRLDLEIDPHKRANCAPSRRAASDYGNAADRS